MDRQRLETLEDINVSNELLERLRQEFQGVVRSVRRIEKVNCVRDLLKLLERQDLLNEASTRRIYDIVAPAEARTVQPLPADMPVEVNSIHELIAYKIGRHWKEFARKLGVNENEIDAYDFNRSLRRDSRMITLQVLISFRQNRLFHNSQEWLSKIRKALDYAKRNDIWEEIDEIVIHQHGLQRF